ncbi:DUF6809 family protein [Paenibacillus donghaensis]|uniref:Uncharacterized protein n=1 Tax=Paenibacillus donghaensis TaxID=414771 RepID=A0A2Z2KU99_9BACL|nr:DUF6809 family protein [Paenibacillus donghaensis]ASA23288.1 hypothetical protein B9T62_22245 [Paenibacillus donghaensis]
MPFPPAYDSHRLETLYSTLSRSNPDYTELSAECNSCIQQIKQAVPDEMQHTLFLYEDAQISLQSILESSIYLQGFKDALHLFSELQGTSGN